MLTKVADDIADTVGRAEAAPILANKRMSEARRRSGASAPGSCGIALRTDAHGDAQGERCLTQTPVDGLGAWHAAGQWS